MVLQHETEYKEILDAVKGSPKEKRLASQFISKFFKHFPHLADTAIDALIDLCEDDDVQIRRQAIKELPALCKDSKKHTASIADILAQLLTATDAAELQQVNMSLIALAKVSRIFLAAITRPASDIGLTLSFGSWSPRRRSTACSRRSAPARCRAAAASSSC